MLRRTLRFLLVLLLIPSVGVAAKPKTSVKIHVEEEITNLNNGGDLSSTAGSSNRYTTYLNVTVVPDTPADPALMNDGKWCIKSMPGETVHLVQGGTYAATLDGSFLGMEIPQPKGKPLKVSFLIFDHKWRTRLDIR